LVTLAQLVLLQQPNKFVLLDTTALLERWTLDNIHSQTVITTLLV
jgi:hypothetical protein